MKYFAKCALLKIIFITFVSWMVLWKMFQSGFWKYKTTSWHTKHFKGLIWRGGMNVSTKKKKNVMFTRVFFAIFYPGEDLHNFLRVLAVLHLSFNKNFSFVSFFSPVLLNILTFQGFISKSEIPQLIHDTKSTNHNCSNQPNLSHYNKVPWTQHAHTNPRLTPPPML